MLVHNLIIIILLLLNKYYNLVLTMQLIFYFKYNKEEQHSRSI